MHRPFRSRSVRNLAMRMRASAHLHLGWLFVRGRLGRRIDRSLSLQPVIASGHAGDIDVTLDACLARQSATVAHAVESFSKVRSRCGTRSAVLHPHFARAAQSESPVVEALKERSIEVYPFLDSYIPNGASGVDFDLAVFNNELDFGHYG